MTNRVTVARYKTLPAMERGSKMADMMAKEREAAQQTAEAVKTGMEEVQAGEPSRAMARMSEGIPVETYMYATAGSILASLLLFLRNKENGIFVGLWAPTILNAALLYKLLKPSRQ